MRAKSKSRCLPVGPIPRCQLLITAADLGIHQSVIGEFRLKMQGPIHAGELLDDGVLEDVVWQIYVSDGTRDTADAASLDERLGGRAEEAGYAGQVGASQEAGSVVQRPQTSQLVRRARYLEGAAARGCSPGPGLGHAAGKVVVDHNVMPAVDADARSAQRPEGPHHHLGVPVAIKRPRRADDAIVDVAQIVKHGAPAGPPPHQPDRRVCPSDFAGALGDARQPVQVNLQPGVLVAAQDDARRVDVQHEDGGVRGRDLQQPVLDGEVEQRIGGPGHVDLRLVGAMAGGGGGVG